jgi:hypothetical protein
MSQARRDAPGRPAYALLGMSWAPFTQGPEPGKLLARQRKLPTLDSRVS